MYKFATDNPTINEMLRILPNTDITIKVLGSGHQVPTYYIM